MPPLVCFLSGLRFFKKPRLLIGLFSLLAEPLSVKYAGPTDDAELTREDADAFESVSALGQQLQSNDTEGSVNLENPRS